LVIERIRHATRSSLSVQSTAILLIYALGTLARYLVEIVFARVSSSSSYGIYTFALNLAQLVAPLAALGLPMATLRFLPSYLASADFPRAKGLLKRSRQLTLIWSACLVSIVYLVARFTGIGGMDEAPVLSALLIGSVAFQNLYVQLGRTLGRAPVTDFAGMLLQPLAAIGLVFLLLQSGTLGISPLAALLLASLCSYAATISLIQLTTAAPLRKVRVHSATQYETREWLRVSLAFVLIGVVAVAMTRIDVLMVGLILGERATGLYGAAAKTARVTAISLVAINALVAARISSLYSQGKLEELQRTVVNAARWMTAPAMVIAFVLVLFGRDVLALFGPAYTRSYPVLAILSVAQLVNAAVGPVAYILNLCGHERVTIRVTGTGLAASVVLSLSLIPLLGPIGAAIGSGLSIVGINLVLYRAARKLVGVRAAFWARTRLDVK